MATLADAYVRVRPDMTRVGPELNRGTEKAAGDAGERAGSHFGKRMVTAIGAAVAVGAAFVGVKLVAGIKESVNAARDLNETTSKVGVIFGKSAKQVEAFAATAATSMGQSKQTALDGAATFAIYGKAAGKSGKDLVKFSTGLTRLASDVGSFSNEDPSQVIEDFGAAMRGEFDPVEKYGILLNETVVKNQALKMGLISTTKDALTPQQRVLAVQAALYKQTTDAQGDFARTSGGLANQQRILSAQWANFKSTIGQALLPVVTQFVTVLNTKLMPALNALWARHGPEITAWLSSATDRFGAFVGRLGSVDWGGLLGDAKAWFSQLREQAGPALADIMQKVGPFTEAMKRDVIPAMKDLREQGGAGMADTLRVTGEVMGFLAEHSDLLAKALPYLAAGFIVVKVAQAAANVAQAISPALTIAQVLANRRLAASNLQLATSMTTQTAVTRAAAGAQVAETAAQNGGIFARARAVVGMAAQRVAMVATRVATVAWTGAQWLLNAAMTANPIGIVIAIVVALVAAIVIAYRNSETFRKTVQGAWAGIQAAAKFAWEKVIQPVLKALVWYFKNVVAPVYLWLWRNIVKPAFDGISAAVSFAWNRVLKPIFEGWVHIIKVVIPGAFRTGVGLIKTAWQKIQDVAKIPVKFVIQTVINKGIIGTFNKVADFLGVTTRLREVGLPAGFAAGGHFDGRLPGRPSDKDNMVASSPRGPVALATGEFIVNARQTARHLPLLKAINSGLGFADGGLFGLLRGPAQWVRSRVGLDAIRERFGSNPLVDLVTGLAGKGRDMLVSKVKGLVKSWFGGSGAAGAGPGFPPWPASPGAQRGDSGVWRSILSLVRGARLPHAFGNAYRPGDPLWHGSGRAVDFMGYEQDRLASFFMAMRPRILELIHTTSRGGYYITRGQRQASMGEQDALHRNHLHVAMAAGGLFGRMRQARSFDTGGLWPTGTFGFNGSGRSEVVASAPTMDEVVALLRELIAAVLSIAPGVGAEINGIGGTLRMRGRTR